MSDISSVAMVTGGSRGIGRACAVALARQGYRVFLTYVSKPEEAEETVRQITEEGGNAQGFFLDVSDAQSVSRFFADHIVKDGVDFAVLVNNAGITRDGLLVRMKDEDFDKVFQVNLRGAFVCLREAAKIMMRRRSGRVINIGSVVGQMGNAGQINYAAAKAGLIAMTKSAAKELGSRNITVNCVSPGFIETDMTASLGDEVKTGYARAIPLGRMGTPEDVAAAVVFLASEGASYITGQTIAVNGGLYC